MITLSDCLSILDEQEDSPALTRFLSLATKRPKLKKGGGYRATYDLKADGVYVHLEYVERVWRVLAVQLLGKEESGFSCYTGELERGLSMKSDRRHLREVLGDPSSSGGDGKIGSLGIVNRLWDRWDHDRYSLRFDYEADGATIYVACLQRPRDVQQFEQRRRANQSAQTTPGSSAPLRV